MRKCKSCFRFRENWRDAESKGYKEKGESFIDYTYRPREGIKTSCSMQKMSIEIDGNSKGCKFHKYRLTWNLHTWWEWKVCYGVRRWYEKNIRCRIGGLREPVELKWVDSFNGMADKIIPNGEPECPNCGEMPYSTKQCVFCGQRFKINN